MRNPFRRKALTGPDIPAALEAGWSAVPLLGGGARQRIVNAYTRAQSANYAWLYEHSPAVRTVIDTIVRNVGQLELRLYEEISPAERQPRPDHPAALSLRYPNESTPSDRFVRTLFKDYLIHDNAYALLTPAANGQQLNLNWLPAHMVAVLGSSLFAAEIYRFWRTFAGGFYQPAGLPYEDFTPDQVLHWHGENPNDPRIGYSRLDTLRSVIAEDVAFQQASLELAQAGLQEPIWIARPLEAPDWSNAARRGFEEEVSNRIRRRHTTPVVLEEGMEMKSFGVTPRDAEMMEVRRWIVQQIAAQYGLPQGMVGLGTSIAEDQQMFYADTLPPYCREFTRMLDQRILVQAYSWTEGSFELNIDEKLMGDDRLRALTSASGRPVMLTNEARARLNLSPVDGGDELVTPLNVIVGENPKPSTDIMPIQSATGPPQDGSYRLEQGSADTPPKALMKAAMPLTQLLPRRAADMQRQHHNIDTFQAVVQRHYNRLARSLPQKSAGTDWQRWDREFSDDIDQALHGVVKSEGDVYMLKFASAENFDMGRVQNYLRAMAEGAATAINDTIRQEIKDMGRDEALAHAPQHIATAGTSLGARSTIWAREEAARQSDTFEQRTKSWVADTGRHAEFDGDTVKLGEDWPGGFAPGQEPNCACTEEVA